MQKITFTTANGAIQFADNNTAMLDGKYVPFQLLDFDPNSVGASQDTVKCIDMDGQHTVSERLNPRSIKITIGFDARNYLDKGEYVSGGEKGMYYFRQQILKAFSLKTFGELSYQNDINTYYITAKMAEFPYIERVGGTYCKATFYLTADYPYWHRTIIGSEFTATSGNPIAISILTDGDLDSPIIGTITCVTPSTGSSGSFFRIIQTVGGTAKMYFVKQLLAGEKLVFNTGLNNEVYVKKIDTSDNITYANEYVDYRNSDLLVNGVGGTSWQFNVLGTGGEMTIRMMYQNIYWAV